MLLKIHHKYILIYIYIKELTQDGSFNMDAHKNYVNL